MCNPGFQEMPPFVTDYHMKWLLLCIFRFNVYAGLASTPNHPVVLQRLQPRTSIYYRSRDTSFLRGNNDVLPLRLAGRSGFTILVIRLQFHVVYRKNNITDSLNELKHILCSRTLCLINLNVCRGGPHQKSKSA